MISSNYLEYIQIFKIKSYQNEDITKVFMQVNEHD